MVDQPKFPIAGEQTDPSLEAADAQTGHVPDHDAPSNYADRVPHSPRSTLEMQPIYTTLTEDSPESEEGSAIRRTGTERDELSPVHNATTPAEHRVDSSATDEHREDSLDPTQDASGSHPDQD